MMAGLKTANLALMLLLELGVLLALGYWGFQVGPSLGAKVVLGLGAPVLAAVVWGVLGAPMSARRLRGIWYQLLKVVFFGSAALALAAAGRQELGVIFASVFVLNFALILIWKQTPDDTPLLDNAVR
jgi:hypothetical protein